MTENATISRWQCCSFFFFFLFNHERLFSSLPWLEQKPFYVASMLQDGEGRRHAQQRDGGEGVKVCIRKQPRAACWIVNKVETLSMHDWSCSVPSSYNMASRQASPPSLSLSLSECLSRPSSTLSEWRKCSFFVSLPLTQGVLNYCAAD